MTFKKIPYLLLSAGILPVFFFLLFFIVNHQSLSARSKPIHSDSKQEEGDDLSKEVLPYNASFYRVSENHELEIYDYAKASWELCRSLPARKSFPFNKEHYIRITALGQDPAQPSRVCVGSQTQLFLSEDQGASWVEISCKAMEGTNNYITAVALSPFDKNIIAVGTSYHGIFLTPDRGKTWQRQSHLIPGLYQGAGFFEEVRGIAFDPQNPRLLFLANGARGNLYVADVPARTSTKMDYPKVLKGRERIDFLGFAPRAVQINKKIDENSDKKGLSRDDENPSGWVLEMRGRKVWYQYSFSSQQWMTQARKDLAEVSLEKQKRLDISRDKKGIYLAAHNAEGKKLDKFIKLLKDNGLNSFVIDLKDDFGRIPYDCQLSRHQKIGAVKEKFKLAEFLKRCHEEDIYVIARLVVFKDPVLYRWQNHKYATWDKVYKKPWGRFRTETNEETGKSRTYQIDFWVDPFAPEVRDYNIDLAVELEREGVDEIQFDYIRFPSDGPVDRIEYRHQPQGMRKADALESFLAKARQKISIPISTDLYGFNSWYSMVYLGQNIDIYKDFIDIISPMLYPSHFPLGFKKDMKYLERAYYIYHEGNLRSWFLSDENLIIRPYVQAFLIGNERNYSLANCYYYLKQQIKGTYDSPADGFILWNNSNKYYMLPPGFKSWLEKLLSD